MAPKLAAKFLIEKYDKSEKQNILIMQKLIAGERLENSMTLEKMNKFSPAKQKILRENSDNINMKYLANLTSENITKLNAIDDSSKFIWFFRNQKESIAKKNLQIKKQSNLNKESENNYINNAVLTIELVEFDSRLDDFLRKGLGESAATELHIQARKNALTKVSEISDDQVKKSGLSREELWKHLERMELLSLAKEKWLDQKYAKEFDELAISLYTLQKENPLLESYWNTELLEYVKNKIVSTYDSVKDTWNDNIDK